MRPLPRQEDSQSSIRPLGTAAVPPASVSSQSFHDQYSDTPYIRYSQRLDPTMTGFDPNSIADDGDEGLEYTQKRSSLLHLTPGARGSNPSLTGGAAATGGVLGALGALASRTGSRSASQYNPVHTTNTAYDPNGYDLGSTEKSEWLKGQHSGRKKWAWIVGSVLLLAVLGGIAAGVAIPLVNKKNSGSTPSDSSISTATGDVAANGDLNKDSAEIKALMNNKNLHKVFPGIDYTPLNTQYPDCLARPPSQNNITRDVALLSQLTNVLRLYGTDCNQTEMLLHSISQLSLQKTMKVGLGVWVDKNETTNARQLSQMYNILDTYGTASFMGVIVGNEVLFSQYKTKWELTTLLRSVKTNLTAKGYGSLPLATSDLGDKWTPNLASAVDVVMASRRAQSSARPAGPPAAARTAAPRLRPRVPAARPAPSPAWTASTRSCRTGCARR
jgi:exo-beta-1,3-glucanase (GH17 family)